MRITVVASMRNEGPFIVEWVSWYRMLGFTDIVVVTNACTDHSPGLLDALQTAGWVHHIRHEVPAGQPITAAKLAVAKAHKSVRRAQWVFVCDVDEFLVVHRGAGRVQDLLPKGEAPFLGMAINWRVFGTCGVEAFRDEPVHRQFALARPLNCSQSTWIKCLFRRPKWFAALGEHGPLGLEKAPEWGSPGMVWVNSEGRPVPGWRPDGPYLRRLPRELASYQVAQVNHYMLRSAESYSLKAGTLSPVAGADRYTDAYFKRANSGQMPDPSAFRHAEAFEAVQAQAMALPRVARLHALCCADHVAAICAKAGRDPAGDARWQGFMARAAE